MSHNKFFPTIEKFTAEVRRCFAAGWTTLSDAEVDAYLATDEASSLINNRFETGKDPYSAADCLILMY